MQHSPLCNLLLLAMAVAWLSVSVADNSGTTDAVAGDPASAKAGESEQHREAFLGKDEAPEFNKLTPDQAKQKLTELLHKIDTNNDQSISMAELVNWMRRVAQKDRLASAAKRFRALKVASDSPKAAAPLTFQEYQLAVQRELLADSEHKAAASNSTTTASEAAAAVNASLAAHMSRSRSHWVMADSDGDGRLTVEELADFIRPEESPRMRGAVVQEALDTADSNRDGRIDLGEHLRDLYTDYDKDRREGKSLPDWVTREEDHFRTRLDLDKDGSLSDDEIYKLVVPDTADHAKTEAKFLFGEADANGDKFLSLDEILNKWKAFVGHGATNFGAFDHDEL
ncbi:hypothetical protein BOX15_Mlig011998g3 [Macrostomum lignano]|uniref:Reticulocalbin-3 n=1 Tax=Macrostomum lignano TaxID=282301 RepID=A0A267FPI8_9PLAT|nr:hypothetical protein BOX15_Mlig011998g3 [Macrostomum lignano]